MAVIDHSEFIQIFIAIVAGWVLISLWVAAINTFVYGYLGFNPNSARHAFFIALLASVIFLFYVFVAPADAQLPTTVITKMAAITTFDTGI